MRVDVQTCTSKEQVISDRWSWRLHSIERRRESVDGERKRKLDSMSGGDECGRRPQRLPLDRPLVTHVYLMCAYFFAPLTRSLASLNRQREELTAPQQQLRCAGWHEDSCFMQRRRRHGFSAKVSKTLTGLALPPRAPLVSCVAAACAQGIAIIIMTPCLVIHCLPLQHLQLK